MVPLRPLARALWLTLLDIGLIVSASAAAVVTLGGRTRFELAGTRVSLRAATNLLLIAGALAVVRLWLGRRDRLLPLLPRPGREAMEAERIRFAAPAGLTTRSSPLGAGRSR